MAEYNFLMYVLCVHFPSVKCQINFQKKCDDKKSPAYDMVYNVKAITPNKCICEC